MVEDYDDVDKVSQVPGFVKVKQTKNYKIDLAMSYYQANIIWKACTYKTPDQGIQGVR